MSINGSHFDEGRMNAHDELRGSHSSDGVNNETKASVHTLIKGLCTLVHSDMQS